MNFNKIKNWMINIYYANKKMIDIFLIFLGIIIVLLIIKAIVDKPNDSDVSKYNLELYGNSSITIYLNDDYIEPGYKAYTDSGLIKTNEVIVTNNVNNKKVGAYTITYRIGDQVKIRIIHVVEKEENDEEENIDDQILTFTLNGIENLSIKQGEIYNEPGYKAFDSKDGDITDKVIVTGKVNTMIPGTYKIVYSVTNSNNVTKSLTRSVTVVADLIDAKLTVSDTSYTNSSVNINISVTGNTFSHIKLPNNAVVHQKNYNYSVSKNGVYQFYIYNIDGTYILKKITVYNIDKTKPVASCMAKIENGKTIINVVAVDNESGISEYKYYGNNKLLTTTNEKTYIYNNKLSNVNVIVSDKVGNLSNIKCNITNNYGLEVHFINVDREDAILIRSSEKVILIDGGRYSKKEIVTPYLKELGIKKIDAMIGSHLHYNHIQAQADILKNFVVDKIYYPQNLKTCYSSYCRKTDQKYILDEIKKQNKEITIMKPGDNIDIGDINIFCIGPISIKKCTTNCENYAQNNNSLNFILTYGKTKFMFTGDHVQSDNIMKKFGNKDLNIDVLKFPHHGSSSMSEELIEELSPKYVIVTNDEDALYSSQRELLEKYGATDFYYSGGYGNILLISDGNNITVKTNVKASDYNRS